MNFPSFRSAPNLGPVGIDWPKLRLIRLIGIAPPNGKLVKDSNNIKCIGPVVTEKTHPLELGLGSKIEATWAIMSE